ncbi:DNA-deoxyinosine glycosylase [Anaerotignum faecicola]|nr:DNA-deoxyinosine glycosylase [Anaerotignum faecicola]
MEYTRIVHTISPVFNSESKILILGSLPSVKSRENNFFYGHPQNRFWKVIAALAGSFVPETIEGKKKLLIENRIALWDVIAECDIIGSSDSSIKNVVPNNLEVILETANIEKIFANGSTAYRLYEKYCKNSSAGGREAFKLPSTSPANAAYSFSRLVESWSIIFS